MHAFLSFLILALTFSSIGVQPPQAVSLEQLEQKLKSQYATIEKTIANPPSPRDSPTVVHLPGQPPYDVADYKRRIRLWQDDIAQSFKAAADTVAEILKLNPPNGDYWRERLDTLKLYAEPVSRPEERTIFGRSEVQKPVKFVDTPLAVYTDEARAAKAKGDVRLRLVLAADGTVKYVFPIKSLRYGLTEAAMNAVRQIKFEPAMRNGSSASVFMTLVYEFESSGSRKPYVPRGEF
jgi:TonB family protein